MRRITPSFVDWANGLVALGVVIGLPAYMLARKLVSLGHGASEEEEPLSAPVLVATRMPVRRAMLAQRAPLTLRLTHAGGLPRGARCPVCTSAFEGPVTVCGACRTPHHPDCFDYNGKCAIFGCWR